MNEAKARAIFLLAGIEAKSFNRLENKYWPVHPDYDQIRRDNPWWLVETKYGLVEIGSRKRVISIDWSRTPIRGEVTKHEVTSSKEYVHAWSYSRAVEYMTEWRHIAEAGAAPAGEATRDSQPSVAGAERPPKGGTE